MRYGYIRVSIDGYSKNQQKLFLEKHQIDKYIFEDNSLKMDSGNQLLNLINKMNAGDKLYVCDFSRLARTTVGLLEIMKYLHSKRVNLYSEKENYDSTNIDSELSINIIESIIEFEKITSLEKQREGIAIAKEEGKPIGRQPTLVSKETFIDLYNDYLERKITKIEFARRLNIARPTLDKFIKAYELSELSEEDDKYFVERK